MSEKNKQTKSFYLSYFEKLYESWEISTQKALTFWFHNPLLSTFMDRAVEKSIEFKNYTQEIIDKTLRYRYVPINNDLMKLTNSIEHFDERLSKLESKIIKTKNTNIRKRAKSKSRRTRK